jgi:hypothetical protein
MSDLAAVDLTLRVDGPSLVRVPFCFRSRQTLGVVELAVSQWRTVGRGLGVSPSELDQFADAFEHDERDAARTARRTAPQRRPFRAGDQAVSAARSAAGSGA